MTYSNKPKMKIEDLSHRFGEQEVLGDISMQVEQGQIVSILGPSGVGKSTLFNLISGILPLQEGRIHLQGEQTGVSYMLQKDLLLEHKTVLDNVILPLILKGEGKDQARRKGMALLESFGLDQVAQTYPNALSGGMRQRVALMRTYMMGRDFFLLDEAFSALDELTKLNLYQWYQDIHRELGLTTLLITHSIEEAISLSNRIYILSGKPGRITANIEIEWDPKGDLELQKLTYVKKIRKELGI